MDFLSNTLQGLGSFGLYFGVSLVGLVIFKTLYALVTPHDEWKLVKEKNLAAAVAFVGAILGFSVALASAAANSVSLIDYVTWALVALVAQVLAFLLVRCYVPQLSQRITDDELPAGIVLAGISIAIGILNAACITY